MPRRSLGGVTSAFERVQRQARGLLVALRGEIRTKENELKRLKDEEARLSTLLGGSIGASAAPATRGGVPRGRIDWRAVLKQMPKQFKASDIRRVRGLKGKRPSEIFAAITRWIEAGLAKRKSRGLYERV
jgi:hypothetical protein